MEATHFTIPAEYRGKLEEVEVLDTRSDQDILETLRHNVPITSEKNVWAYWHSGVDNASNFAKQNICNWVRKLGSAWTVRILDKVPDSPNHALNWVPGEMLPEAWTKDRFEGSWAGPHSSDCLRGALLYLYGGCYSDVGTLMFRHLDDMFWNQLEDPASPYEVVATVAFGQIIANGFVGSRKGNMFIKLWHELFTHLWRDGKTSVVGMIDDPLLAFSKHAPPPEPGQGPAWEWNIPMERLLEYLSQSCCWARLCKLEAPIEGFNAAEFWMNNVLCLSYADEALPFEQAVGYKDTGHKVDKLLSMKVDAPEDVKASAEYKQAYELVWKTLSEYSIQKLGHGKDIIDDVQLLVVLRENPGREEEPGTFYHLLRHGIVHFRQTRSSTKPCAPERPAITVKRGLLEPPPAGEMI
ncbi:hypothetical protein CC79DRAFT_1366282 [Sarocladium strictum]